jgi:hypothetical protein
MNTNDDEDCKQERNSFGEDNDDDDDTLVVIHAQMDRQYIQSLDWSKTLDLIIGRQWRWNCTPWNMKRIHGR